MSPGVSFVPSTHLSPLASSLVMDVAGTLGFLALIAYALVRRRRELRLAEVAQRSYQPDAPLEPGERVIAGTVERAQGATCAVRVEIDQAGQQWERQGELRHSWTETGRRVYVEPFYIRHASGRRVRVEPRYDVQIVDALDSVVMINLQRRKRVAELTPGEHVHAHGMLVRGADPEVTPDGYRRSAEGLVLHPPQDRPMALSTEPLAQRFLVKARLHGRAALMIALIALASHAFHFGYYARRWLGEDAEARVVAREEPSPGLQRGAPQVYRLRVQTLDGAHEFTERVSPGVYLRFLNGHVIPVRLVRAAPALSRLGTKVTVHAGSSFVIGLLALAALYYRWLLERSRPWYERRLVDHGAGPLSASSSGT